MILTRNTGQAIVAMLEDGREITLTVLGVKGGQVRLGVDAPKEIQVHREEIAVKVRNEAKA